MIRQLNILIGYVMSLLCCSLFLIIISISISKLLSSSYYNESDHVPIILFKLPRTGSTWLTERLNSIPHVYVSKEIIQRSDLTKYNTEEQESFLIQALKVPTSKISDKDKILPSTRYFQDYYFHNTFKLFRKMEVLGFTLNPEHSKNVNWHHVYNTNNNIRVIVLRRGNVIKAALSGYRGKETKMKCGESNIRSNSNMNNGNCILNRVNLTNYEFAIEIKRWQERFDNFDNFINALPFEKTIVYYEELQQAFNTHIHRLFNDIGMEKLLHNQDIDSKSVWMKRNPEDLSKIILNYDSIKNALSNGNCSCLLEQLESKESFVFRDRCKVKINIIDDIIKC
jgi:LPS sulfotransferase NodH